MTTQLGSIVKTSTIDTVARLLGRYGLVVVIGWIGLLKFANYEAHPGWRSIRHNDASPLGCATGKAPHPTGRSHLAD